jgi:uncharacterized protein (DUF2062 family)
LAHKILGPGIFDHRLWKPHRQTVAKGFAVGVFFGLLPIFGLQILASVLVAYFWRVNLSAAILATFISNPITAGPLILLQLEIGKWVGPNIPVSDLGQVTGTVAYVLHHGKPFFIGSITSAVAAAILAYPGMLLFWDSLGKMRKGKVQGPKDARGGDPFSAAGPSSLSAGGKEEKTLPPGEPAPSSNPPASEGGEPSSPQGMPLT